MLKTHNSYSVLSNSTIISFDNVQQIGELITLKTLRGRVSGWRSIANLYVKYVKDLNRNNNPNHVISDAYDLAQTAICFLCEFIGRNLDDLYTVKNGKEITIRKATYLLIGRTIDRMYRSNIRSCDIDIHENDLSVEIDHYEEKDYTEVDRIIDQLNLKPREREILEYYMSGMEVNYISDKLGIHRSNVWRGRARIQAKYELLFK